MLCSVISRISRLASHGGKNYQYIRTLNRTEYRQETCGFKISVPSCCVQNSQTNFSTDGTVSAANDHVHGRSFHKLTSMMNQQVRTFSSSQWRQKKEEITVNFLNRDGETFTVKGKVGESLLDVVIDNDVDIDGFGACEGTLACSTCHLLFDEDTFETLPEKLDEEEDMLDLAYGLEDTSRLGCQISLTKEMDNMIVKVPEGINDARDV